MSIDNGTGNTFTITQNANVANDNLIQFNKLYGHTMYFGQSGDLHIPYSPNGDGMIYRAQDNDFVIYTNSAQQTVFNNATITFNKPLKAPSTFDCIYTLITKLTCIVVLPAGFNDMFSFTISTTGTYSIDTRLTYEYVVGQAQ